jgi:hypothetical protein
MNKLVTALMLLVATTSVSLAANQNPDRDPTRGFAIGVDSQTTSSTNHAASLPRYLIAKDNAQLQPNNGPAERAPWAGN